MYDFMFHAKLLNKKYPLYRSKEHNASFTNDNVIGRNKMLLIRTKVQN